MPTYVISDIHGCFKEYQALLTKISLTDQDRLYVLGDAMDRGPDSIRVMLDIMSRKNVTYLLGNHDFMMLTVLKKAQQREDTSAALAEWADNGGMVTLEQYLALPPETQNAVWKYLNRTPAYAELHCGGNFYTLVHAGLPDFEEEKPLENYPVDGLVWERADYEKRYFRDPHHFLVTGHTPTPLIRRDRRPLVYEGIGHIALDCGCVFGGRLAAYRLETREPVYVQSSVNRRGTCGQPQNLE